MYHNRCSQQLHVTSDRHHSDQLDITGSVVMLRCMPETTAPESRDALPACLALLHKPTSHKLSVAVPRVSDASISMFSTSAYKFNSMCIGYGALVGASYGLVDQRQHLALLCLIQPCPVLP